jgi:hypothetical protein
VHHPWVGHMEEATQVSGSEDLQSLEEFSQAGAAGSWKPSVPGKEKGSGVLPRSFSGNKNSEGGQESPIQPGKTKPCCPASCLWRCQNLNQPGF